MHPIKRARVNSGMTQDRLAELSGVKQSMISKYENWTPVQDKDVPALARALQTVESQFRRQMPKPTVIRDLRKSRGMAKHILAKHCCVSTTMVSQWENGKPISSHHRGTLSLVFGIDSSFFRPGAVLPPGLQPEYSTERDCVRGELLSIIPDLSAAQLRRLLLTAKEMQNVTA